MSAPAETPRLSRTRAETLAEGLETGEFVNGPPDAEEPETEQAKKPPKLRVINAADVKQRPVEWVVPYWIPRRVITLLAGSPGMGKTTLAMKLAAMLGHGEQFPGQTTPCATGRVLVWSGEDTLEETLAPRLTASGPSRHVDFIEGIGESAKTARPFEPASDMDAICQHLRTTKYDLLVLDPIIAVAGNARDSYRAEEIRRALEPVQRLARDHNIAVLGVTHFLKRHNSTGSGPLDRVIGSQAWGAVARAVLVVDKNDSGNRILMRAKSNFGPTKGGVQYDLKADGRDIVSAVFGDPVDGFAEDVMTSGPGEDKDKAAARLTAEDFILESLKSARPAAKSWQDLESEGSAEQITPRTMRRARDRLKSSRKIAVQKVGSAWLWRLSG